MFRKNVNNKNFPEFVRDDIFLWILLFAAIGILFLAYELFIDHQQIVVVFPKKGSNTSSQSNNLNVKSVSSLENELNQVASTDGSQVQQGLSSSIQDISNEENSL